MFYACEFIIIVIVILFWKYEKKEEIEHNKEIFSEMRFAK